MRPPTLTELLAAHPTPEGAEAFPCQITILCDECGVEFTADYVVDTAMTKNERFDTARRHLVDYQGWSCADEDLCTTCTETVRAEALQSLKPEPVNPPHPAPTTCTITPKPGICGDYPHCACGV